MVEKWRHYSDTGERIPLSEHSYDCVMKSLTRYAFGEYFKNEEALHEFRRDYDHVSSSNSLYIHSAPNSQLFRLILNSSKIVVVFMHCDEKCSLFVTKR